MKQAVMTAPGQIMFQNFPDPKPADDKVLVKIEAVGLCTWERKIFNSGPFPFVGGHEICGVVEKTGSKVPRDIPVGTRVVVASLTRCGECYYCCRGMDNLCENPGEDSLPGGLWGPGGFSEFILVRGYEVYPVSSDIDPAIGTLAEPLACVIRSMDRGKPGFGDTVLVLGGGIMGILHLLLAKQRGARVILSEPDRGRRERALSFGADAVVDPLSVPVEKFTREHTGGRGAEVCFFTAGGAPAIEGGIRSMVKNGTLVVYGGTDKKDRVSLDPALLHYDEINLTGVTKHTKNTFLRAAALISAGSLPLGKLVSTRFPFEEILEGFKRADSLDEYRVVLELNKTGSV